MAQHLLVAADRYGLDKLKAICQERLTLDIGIDTGSSREAQLLPAQG
jgi:speckle-type POZ protein